MEHRQNIENHVKNTVTNYVSKGVKIVFFILFGIAIAFLVGYLVMRLWNWLMPELFGLTTLNYWQAVGLLILAKIIFGFGGGSGPGKKTHARKTSRFKKCNTLPSDFSEWKHYDEFWSQEGEKAFQDYLQRKQTENKA